MSEQRQYLRLPVQSSTFVEIEAPGIGENENGRVATCKSLNVSQRGLQVELEEEITIGALLQLGVVLPSTEDTLYLVGEVRWCIPGKEEPDTWLAGFQLMNASDSDIERWIDLVEKLES